MYVSARVTALQQPVAIAAAWAGMDLGNSLVMQPRKIKDLSVCMHGHLRR